MKLKKKKEERKTLLLSLKALHQWIVKQNIIKSNIAFYSSEGNNNVLRRAN